MPHLVATRLWLLLIAMSFAMGCRSPRPFTEVSHRTQPLSIRSWDPTLEKLPSAEFRGDFVLLRDVRNFRYVSDDVYVPDYYDRTYDLNLIRSVDFIVVPFKVTPVLAHTMMSFGFDDDQYVAVSVEARREAGERYSPLFGAANQFELIYVVADERDVIPLRTKHRQDPTYVYRTKATPEQARALFVDVMKRVNKLKTDPEFYNTLTNNCTTNIRRHVNRIATRAYSLGHRCAVARSVR